MSYLIVGSGPSGVMAAQALLDRGASVTLLDAGVELEPAKRSAAERLGRLPFETWPEGLIRIIRPPESVEQTDPKLCFGSDYPYASPGEGWLHQAGTRCLQSFAKGGLSTVWGAAVLPNRPEDFEGWPVSWQEMSPHYAAAASFLGIAGRSDDLERLFPFFAPPRPPARPSRQAEALLDRMRSKAAALGRQGLVFGQSRLALRTEEDAAGPACQFTGFCLSGCPYRAIWNAADALDGLARRPDFTYRSGLRLSRAEGSPSGARLLLERLDGSGSETVEGDRAFLGCGALSTARVALDSLGVMDRTLKLRFQPYFLLPVMAIKNTSGVDSERLHTLAQIFIEMFDARISAYPVHLQLYTFNQFIQTRLARVSRLMGPFKGLARSVLEGRLMVIQGYLDSSLGGSIDLTGRIDPASGGCRLELLARPDPRLRGVIHRVVAKLARLGGDLGWLPIWPMLRIGSPGEGNHVGGSFPMSGSPAGLETDRLGRLPGLPRVHLIDASVLPRLAPTTLTYTVMANARRIALGAAAEDGLR